MSRILRIAWREYVSYVRTVGFWISLCAMPLALYGVTALPGLMERTTPPPRLAIVDLTGQGLGAALQTTLAEDETRSGPKSIDVVAAPPAALAAPSPAAAGAVLRDYLIAAPGAGARASTTPWCSAARRTGSGSTCGPTTCPTRRWRGACARPWLGCCATNA